MIFFSFIGCILSFLFILALISKEANKILNKNINEKQAIRYFLRRIPGKLFICLIIIFITSIILPPTIWTLSSKEIEPVEVPHNTTEIYPFDNSNQYIKIETIDNKKVYKINCKNENIKNTFDFDNTDIIKVSTKEKAKYVEIDYYEKIRIKDKNIITNATNDIFCDKTGWKKKFVKKKYRIYIHL